MNHLRNLQDEAKRITLSPAEKAFMRSQIFIQPEAPSYAVSHFRFFSVRFMPAMAAVLIVMLGSGTTYAAQGALPGDLLYSVKVGVNEPLQQVLAVSTEAKAEFHASVAEERLEEAEALAAEGRLSASTSAQIETSLDTHLSRVEEITALLEEEDKEGFAVELTAELESALSAHGSILAALGGESDDDETKEHSGRLVSRLSSRSLARAEFDSARTIVFKAAPAEEASFTTTTADIAADASAESMVMMQVAEPATSSAGDEAQKRASLQLKAKAEIMIEDAKDIFDDMKSALDAATTARVEAQFKMLEDQMQNGESLYGEGEYLAARATFSATISDTAALNAYLGAEKRFSRNLLRSWVDDRFGRFYDDEFEVEVEFEEEEEVKGEQVEREGNEHDEGDSKDGKDGEDGKNGKDGKSDKNDDEHSSSSVKAEVSLGL